MNLSIAAHVRRARVMSLALVAALVLGAVALLNASAPPPARDLVYFSSSTSTWHIRSAATNFGSESSYPWGLSNDVPLLAELDGDGKMDLVAYRPSTGEWWIRSSSSGYALSAWSLFQWGLPGDIPVVADFDGDGQSELTIFRPTTGEWWIRFSSLGYAIGNSYAVYQWGLPGDIPLVGDFDGDHKAELTVYRPSTGEWFFRYSTLGWAVANAWASYQWGQVGDVPLVGDYDGDGRRDLTVYRPSTGQWWFRYSSTNYSTSGMQQWGQPDPSWPDQPIAGDIDGDGKDDPLVHRPTTGEWRASLTTPNFTGTFSYAPFGLFADSPMSPSMTANTTPQMWVDTPSPQSTVSGPFTISGFAVDLSSVSGTGVDQVDVWAAPIGSLSSSFWGTANYGEPRSDVASVFGSRYLNSGWSLSQAPTAGSYYVMAFAHSVVKNDWDQAYTFPVIVALPTTTQQVIPCPASSTKMWGPIQIPNGAWETPAGALDVKPCETVKVTVTARALNCCGSMSVFVDNNSNSTLFWKHFTVGSTATTFELPNNTGDSGPAGDPYGRPYPSTRGDVGLPAKIRFTSLYAAEFSISVERTPRVGYNIGGVSFVGAKPIRLGVTQYGSLIGGEAGQFYRVTVPAGASIWPVGQATGSAAVNPDFTIRVYDMNQAWLASLLSGQFTTIKTFPTGTPVTWTNASGQAKDVIVLLQTNLYGFIRDFRVTLACSCTIAPSTLTLFLDDGTGFDPGNPAGTNRWSAFVPGSSPGGSSLPVPTSGATPIQIVSLIAGYVDSSGVVVQPPDPSQALTFSLSGTSAFEGVAMNWHDPRGDNASDYELQQSQAFFQTDYTARVNLRVWDYGGKTTAEVAVAGATATPISIPKDEAPANLLPDASWLAGGQLVVLPNDPLADSDGPGNATGILGDNLSAFEEYRGFVVNGVHARTDPSAKDVFVAVADSLMGLVLSSDQPPLEYVRQHVITLSEIGDGRVVGPNVGGGVPVLPGQRQQGMIVYHELAYLGIQPVGGLVPCPSTPSPFVCYPNIIGSMYATNGVYSDFEAIHNIKITLSHIRVNSPPTFTDGTPDPVDAEAFKLVVGHELAHGISVGHNSDQSSIMREFVQGSTSQGQAAVWTTSTPLMHTYLPSDVSQIRVH